MLSPSSSHVCYSCSWKYSAHLSAQWLKNLRNNQHPESRMVAGGCMWIIHIHFWVKKICLEGKLRVKLYTNWYWKFICMEISKRKTTGMSNWSSWSEKCLKTWFYVLDRQYRAFCHSLKYLNHKSTFKIRVFIFCLMFACTQNTKCKEKSFSWMHFWIHLTFRTFDKLITLLFYLQILLRAKI